MTKLIKKKDCKFKNQQIVKGDELIGIPYVVYGELTKLEVMLQQYYYLRSQPAYQAAPSLEGFKRKSLVDESMPYIEMPETPVGDARVEEAMKFMAEVDEVTNVAETNQMLDRFRDLVLWCDSKKFVEDSCLLPIDTPALGNPLKLTGETIANILMMIASSPIDLGDPEPWVI